VCKISRSPIPGQSHDVFEDVIAHRGFALTGEASYGSCKPIIGNDRKEQEETQVRPKLCEVADDSVVVKKFRPMKSGDRAEDKTGMTRWLCPLGAVVRQKP